MEDREEAVALCPALRANQGESRLIKVGREVKATDGTDFTDIEGGGTGGAKFRVPGLGCKGNSKMEDSEEAVAGSAVKPSQTKSNHFFGSPSGELMGGRF